MAVKGLTSTENIRLIRDGKKRVWRWGPKREIIIYTYRYTVTTRIKMGSDESHCNVS